MYPLGRLPYTPTNRTYTDWLATPNRRLRNTFKDVQGMHYPPTTPCGESAGLL